MRADAGGLLGASGRGVNNLTRSVECRVAHGLIEFLTRCQNVSTRQFENAGPRLSVAMGTVKLRFCEVSAF